MQLVQHPQIAWNKIRFENQILRRISGQGELGGQDHLSATPFQVPTGRDDLPGIFGKIADSRVDLSKSNFHNFTKTPIV